MSDPSYYAFTRTFDDVGDFAATKRAQTFLNTRGFSVGSPQLGHPRGILWGFPRIVGGWTNLTIAQRDELVGIIEGDHLNGPVTVTIFARAPAAARMAVRPQRAA